ncbi:MAG: tRNA pseudouridine(38-40) synthase TruA [Cyclobacteriaceae bacterium]|nr:tRNA pseudouridine(38-40) synthase TruA [Cyclobacteriaceae bacterium]
MRYFFEIGYKGTEFHGWQRQNNAISVQEVVENTLRTIFRTPIPITASGRTDTGVHCIQQYFHADFASKIKNIEYAQYRINRLLPQSVTIRNIFPVEDTAHARFDAENRYYEYVITTAKDPLLMGLAYPFFRPLDIKTMNEAAALLIGERDFQSFSKVKTDVNTFICTIFTAYWRVENDLLIFGIRGNRFLRGMVRALVGTLLEVGQKKLSVEEFEMIIQKKDRQNAGMAVPAEGLYLKEVNYPEGYFTVKNG